MVVFPQSHFEHTGLGVPSTQGGFVVFRSFDLFKCHNAKDDTVCKYITLRFTKAYSPPAPVERVEETLIDRQAWHEPLNDLLLKIYSGNLFLLPQLLENHHFSNPTQGIYVIWKPKGFESLARFPPLRVL
jgi:hypothetical protein